jgi:hypothetical protein
MIVTTKNTIFFVVALVQSGKNLRTLQREVLSPSSGLTGQVRPGHVSVYIFTKFISCNTRSFTWLKVSKAHLKIIDVMNR